MQDTPISESELFAEVRRIRRLPPNDRRDAVGRLGEGGGLENAIVLLCLLEDRSPKARLLEVDALSCIGGPLARIGARLLLDDAVDYVRMEAVEVLGRIGRKQDVPKIARMLERDISWSVRSSAADALGDLGFRAGRPALERALRSDLEPVVRRDAALGLASVGGAEAIGVLTDAVAIEIDGLTRVGIFYGLYELGERQFLTDLLAILDHHTDPLVLDNVINLIEPRALLADEAGTVIAAVQRLLEDDRVQTGPGKWVGLRGDAENLLKALTAPRSGADIPRDDQ